MARLKREHIVPGNFVKVTRQGKRGFSDSFNLNPQHLLGGGSMGPIGINTIIKIQSLPKKRDGINLVKIEIVNAQNSLVGDVYYTDLINYCEAIDSKFAPLA